MDLARSFTFVFEDADWVKKVLIAGVMLFIPVIGWFVVGGWALEITRRLAQGEGEALPEWDDFGGYLMRGLKAAVVSIGYTLPTLLLSICQMAFAMLGSPDVVGYDTARAMGPVVSLVALCFACLIFLYSIFISVILPAALAKFVAEGDSLGAAFRFGEVFALVRNNFSVYLLVLVGGFIAGLLSGVGTIACFVGVLFTMAYAAAVTGHLYGQAYRAATAAAAA